MAFNSNSYHRNKARKRATEYLAEARQRRADGWHVDAVARSVKLARLTWATYLSYLRVDRMNADMAKVHDGTMKAADFITKWE